MRSTQRVRNSRFRPHSGPEAWIDDAIRGLAVDDERVTVSARVHDAVLREWDQQHAVRTRRRARYRSSRGAWVAVPAAAAVIVAAAALQRESVPNGQMGSGVIFRGQDRQPTAQQPPVSSKNDSRPHLLPPAALGRPTAGSARSPAAIDGSLGYVIVPAPLVDPSALHVVRARISRAALATLGVPIVDPDVDGLVEIEMLVGDDGVAQSIRHAALVND